MHRWDPETPVEETLEALHDVVRAGKARYIGASSMYAWQFAKAQYTARRHGWTRFVSMQNHYNLVYREEEREMNPLCRRPGRRPHPVEPAGPRPAHRHRAAAAAAGTPLRARTDEFGDSLYSDDDFAVVDVVDAIASARGVPAAQVALAWLLHQPGVTAPIFGATKLAHVDDAVAATDARRSTTRS